MKELNEKELKAIEGGFLDLLLTAAEAVYDVFTGEGLIGKTAMYANYYRAQMPSNWTGHGY